MQRPPIRIRQQKIPFPWYHTTSQYNLLNVNEWIAAGPWKRLLINR